MSKNHYTKKGNTIIKQLELLRQIDQAILNSADELDKTFSVILNGIVNLTGSKYANISMVHKNCLVIKASTEPDNVGMKLPIDDSVSGMAVLNKQPVNIRNITKEARYKPLFAEQMKSELAVPLIISQRIIGVLNAESPQLNAFSEADKDLLITLAGQAAIAIRNARSYEELKTLREIDKTILNSAINLDATLNTLLENAARLLGATFGSLLLVEYEDLVIRASIGTTESRISFRVPINDSVTGLAFIKQKPIIIGDVTQEPLYKITLKREKMYSELAVPLIANQRPIGVLNIESPDINAFDEDDARLLQSLADQAAIAVRNAQSYETVKILHEIDNSILSASTDIKSTLQTILFGAIRLTHATHGGVMLIDGDYLENAATTTSIEDLAQTRVAITDSIAGLACQRKKPVLVPDVSKESLYKRVSKTKQMCSELAVPMLDKKRVLGVINLESTRLDAFDENHKQLLVTLAGQAAIAIKNARSRQRLEMLRGVDRAMLTSASDLADTLNEILRGSLLLLNAKYGNLLLLDGIELVIEATTTTPAEDEIGLRLPIADSISGIPVLTKKPVIISDVDQEDKYYRVLKDEHMRSEIVVPLRENGHVFGVLNIESPTCSAFTIEDQEILELLADQAAIAIKNAKNNKKLQALRKIDEAILSHDSLLEDTLDIVLRSSLELINAQYGNILLLKGEYLEICATSAPQDELLGAKVHINESVTGKAAILKQAVVVPDTEQEPLYRRVLTFKHMRSELSVPLMEHGNVLGVINVESPRLSAFTESDRELLEALAGQAAIAISLARSRKETHTLGEIDKIILDSEKNLPEKLDTILDMIINIFNVPFGNIFHVEGNDLVAMATTLEPKELLLGKRFRINNDMIKNVIKNKETVILDNTSQQPHYTPALREESRSGSLAPMVVNDHVIGILNLGSPRLNSFSEYDRKFLKTLAGQIAIAVKNAEIQEELQQIRAIKAVGDAASWLVHKIGNLALNISWPAERLLEELAEPEPDIESMWEDIEMIQRAADRIGDLKQNLLNPLQESESELVAIESLLKETAYKSALPNETLRFRIEDNLPSILISRKEITDVFEEIIDNAIVAMANRPDKSLEIIAYQTPDKEYVEIKFCDNGCGLDQNAKDEIWVAGYTTKQKQSGTGFGLYKCTQIISRRNGHISATSNPDGGATFTVKLPVFREV